MMRRSLLLFLFLGLAGSALFAQEAGTLSFSLEPGMNIPLGTSGSQYTVGGGGELKAYYILPFLPFTHALVGLNYSLLPTTVKTNVSTLALGVGGGVNYTLAQNLHLMASLEGGAFTGMYNSQYAVNPFVQASADAVWSFVPALSIGLGASYKYYFASPDPFFNGVSVYLATVLHLGREKRAQVKIKSIEMQPVFPILRKFYDDNPLGSIIIRNGEQGSIRDVKVSLFAKQYMDAPKQSEVLPEMKQNEEKEIPLLALFTDNILGVTEATKAQAEITVEYTFNKTSLVVKQAQTMRILDRNAMTWDDDRKTVAFVTSKDPMVLQFSKHVSGMVRDKWSPALDNKLLVAIGMHEALTSYGIQYVDDPSATYEVRHNNKVAVDFLQFPSQTLQYKAGNCTGISILYNALLESVGVETAFITVPGHMFTAFAVEASPDDLEAHYMKTEDFIIKNDKVWIPVETTAIGEGFLRAWELGAREWRKSNPVGEAGFYSTHDSWKIYEPVGFQGVSQQVSLPDEKRVLERFFKEKQKFVDREIQPRVADLMNKIQSSSDNAQYRNRLGTVYARYGMYPDAEKQYQIAITAKKYFPAIVNMGNVQFLKNDMTSALAYYRMALALSSDDARILLNVALTYQELGKNDEAKKYYFQAKEKDPVLALKYRFIETAEDKGLRGAEVEARSIEWEDQ